MKLKSLSRAWSRVLLLLIVALMGATVATAQGNSAVRFVHVIPDAAPIDVYINGTLAATSLNYGEATTYISVPAGDHAIAATPAGIGTPLWQQNFTATADEAATLIASSAASPSFDQFGDNTTATSFGVTRLLLVHALADGPDVDVQLAQPIELNGVIQDAGTAIAQALSYTGSFGAFDLPAQTYVVNVLPSGGTGFEALLSELTLPLSSGVSYMAVVYGTPDNPQALLLAAPTSGTADSGFVRFAHAVVGAPNVDVYVNDTMIVPQLSTTSPSEHIALPTGTHSILLRVAGTEDEVLSGEFTVEAGGAQTIVALPGEAEGSVDVRIFEDDLSGLTPNQSVVSVVNAVPAATADASLGDGSAIASAVEFGRKSPSTALPPAFAELGVSLTVDGNTGQISAPATGFYGGVYYNVIILEGGAFSGPSIIIAPTSLAQELGSAPEADSRTLDADTASAPAPATEAPSEVVAAAPTVAAPAAATPVPQQPVAVDTTNDDAVTGRVILDPSANLQLRQRPTSDALSLGLAPSGTTLIVNGREGRPVALVDGEPDPPEAEDFVDPAEELAENEDLDPNETWLNVTYTTPDGGTIEAWVLAQFLTVRDEDGDLQRLANLVTVPGNVAGEASGTELTPPPIPEDRVVAEVFNLNPGVNLNLRRTPTTQGEVLARLDLNTRVELLGFLDPFSVEGDEETETPTPIATIVPDLEDAEWAFISFQPAEGGTVTGWVSTLYVRYEFNGRRINIEELQERELIEPISAERVGEIGGGAPVLAQPTADPLRDAYVGEVVLDAGANLQFRISPDRDSESLNLIPSGTQLLLESRTAEADWVKTTFEGQEGWVSSQFLFITFNGQAVDLLDIPVEPQTETDEDDEDSNG